MLADGPAAILMQQAEQKVRRLDVRDAMTGGLLLGEFHDLTRAPRSGFFHLCASE